MVLDGSPVGTIILGLGRQKVDWSGTPHQLYETITKIADKKVAAGAGWPKTVHAFGNELRRIAPQLRLNGLSITLERRSEARIVTLRSE